MKAWTADMLPPGFRECRPCGRFAKAATCRVCGKSMTPIGAIPRTQPARAGAASAEDMRRQPPIAGAASKARKAPAGPNKTEAEYRRLYLPESARFEGLTFRMANGHRYTPDCIVIRTDGQVECHEVKGSYKLGSYQRARLAFDQARVEWPGLTWIWAEKRKEGWRKSEEVP